MNVAVRYLYLLFKTRRRKRPVKVLSQYPEIKINGMFSARGAWNIDLNEEIADFKDT